MKRTKPQFNQFRKAFKKWRKKHDDEIGYYVVFKDGVEIYNRDDRYITSYIASEYVKYMKYQMRGYKRKRA